MSTKYPVVRFQITILKTFVRTELLEAGDLFLGHSELPWRKTSGEAETGNQQQQSNREGLSGDFHERHFAKVYGFMPATRSFAALALDRCRFLRVLNRRRRLSNST